ILQEVAGKILPDGTIADHASVALARLRREIEKQKKSIHDSLERFLRAHKEEGVLQEEIVTIRNERFVVPVISGQRKRIDGVIHGASSSGHTLFVEPLETIDLNNDLVRLTEEEMRESHRILREITERLRGYSEPIRQTLVTMGELEILFAKGRFAVEFDCEAAFCEQNLELAHGDQSLPDRLGVTAEPLGDFPQDAMGLAHLFFGKAYEVVVQVYGFQRFDEQRVPARAGAVDDSIDSLALPGDHWH